MPILLLIQYRKNNFIYTMDIAFILFFNLKKIKLYGLFYKLLQFFGIVIIEKYIMNPEDDTK